MRPWRFAGLLPLFVCAACSPPVEATGVAGDVAGVRFTSPQAIFNVEARGQSVSSEAVLITDVPDPCAHLAFNWFDVDGVEVDGVRQPSLALKSGTATLQTGTPDGRLFSDDVFVQLTSSTAAERRGRFTARFDAGTYEGTFVAERCGDLYTGCQAGGGAVPLWGAALLAVARLLRRRGRRPGRAGPPAPPK